MKFMQTREQELASEQLKAISMLVKLARRLFIAHEARELIGSTNYFEGEIRDASYELSLSTLSLEQNLKIVAESS